VLPAACCWTQSQQPGHPRDGTLLPAMPGNHCRSPGALQRRKAKERERRGAKLAVASPGAGKKAKKAHYINGRPVDRSKRRRRSKGSSSAAAKSSRVKQGGLGDKLMAAGLTGLAMSSGAAGTKTKRTNKPRRPTHKGYAPKGYSQALPKSAGAARSGSLAEKLLAMRAAKELVAP
jgi:hypothetical protein